MPEGRKLDVILVERLPVTRSRTPADHASKLAELRSHSVIQVLSTAVGEPERIHQMRVVRGAGRGRRLAGIARGIERVEDAGAAVGVVGLMVAKKAVCLESRHPDHAAVGVLHQNCLIAVVSGQNRRTQLCRTEIIRRMKRPNPAARS